MANAERSTAMDADDLPPIKAVYDDELAGFLRGLGILEDLESGKLTCFFCDTVVGYDNLLAIVPIRNEIAVVCDKSECQEALSEQSVAE